MDTSTPPPTATPPPSAFAYQAAKASWVSAVVVFIVAAFGGRVGPKVVIELVSLLLMVVGVILGIIALLGIRKHGTKRILAPSLVGIAINGLLIFIFVTNFLAARARARKAATMTISPTFVVSSAVCGQGIRYEFRRTAAG